MNTYTPRDPQGQFQSWNTRVDEANRNGLSSGFSQGYSEGSEYNGTDAALGVLAMAVGAALWEVGKAIRRRFED